MHGFSETGARSCVEKYPRTGFLGFCTTPWATRGRVAHIPTAPNCYAPPARREDIFTEPLWEDIFTDLRQRCSGSGRRIGAIVESQRRLGGAQTAERQGVRRTREDFV
jgi:hypothetical protein